MKRLDRMLERRTASDEIVIASRMDEAVRSLQKSETVRYLIGATQPIDPGYTEKTKYEASRVQQQLANRLDVPVEFELQGSVLCDIHVKAKSDIDLLVILKEFEWLEKPQQPQIPYQGDPYQRMRYLREKSIESLTIAFPAATVLVDGAKAVKISGGSLRRDVDVVPATWYNTNDYARFGNPVDRGVKVFDCKVPEFIANLPFLHAKRIDERDHTTRGGLRKAVRLMKSLAYDSDKRVTMSMYNITGIAYNIDSFTLWNAAPDNRELHVLEACHSYCQRLLADSLERTSISVPDQHRTVFGGKDGATVDQLRQLAHEIASFREELYRENMAEFQSLLEGRAYTLPRLM